MVIIISTVIQILLKYENVPKSHSPTENLVKASKIFRST